MECLFLRHYNLTLGRWFLFKNVLTLLRLDQNWDADLFLWIASRSGPKLKVSILNKCKKESNQHYWCKKIYFEKNTIRNYI